MSEYIRFVSYVYTYRGHKRDKNVGYVKFEQRFGTNRILAKLTDLKCSEDMRVYLIYKEKSKFIGIEIDKLTVKNRQGELSYVHTGELFGDAECTLSDLLGIIFFPGRESTVDTECEYLLSLWKNEPFFYEHFVRCKKDLVKIPENEKQQKNVIISQEPQNEITVVSSKSWEHLLNIYPKVCPFPYENDICCLRVSPGDIGRLPKENWHLASNSFLLHSYYQYRYLLFFRTGKKEEAKVYLAVPGTFTENEKFMAEMFGFMDFKPSPVSRHNNAAFGYWVTEILMTD